MQRIKNFNIKKLTNSSLIYILNMKSLNLIQIK